MELNKDVLFNYADLKEEVENQAEKVLKEYFKFKNWKFPSDFILEDVQIDDKIKVYVIDSGEYSIMLFTGEY